MLRAGAAHDAWVPAVIAAGLAALGAVSLQLSALLSVVPQAPMELSWLLGWVLLTWATIAAAVALVMTRRSRLTPRAPVAPSIVLAAAAVAVVVLSAALHPPFGTGGGGG
ncbi:hypothetical protein [Agrococcus sp. TF02-05]|uniref:hypothetical protein n=1 Tax=Agrococcus sp. TF02-05 TaxID=2815211 RepID=UPI001AA13865|nr:hypothetical protein [Agrococcus sp. TF02-05]MBO1770856.1 hypothetical protein [Agrococcus sp. TF02-05]